MAITVSQTRRSAKVLYRWCLADGEVDESRVRRVVAQVLRSKRRGYLAVLGEFKRLVKLQRALHSAAVESAVPLNAALQSRLRENLQRQYGAGLTTVFKQNTALIGGIRIRVADDVYDSSVKSKLGLLAKSFGILDEGKAVR